MIEEIRVRYGLDAPGVLSAMLQVPREEFVSKRDKRFAYKDGPIPISEGQTISQPFTVAFMTSLLDLGGDEKVLEIGTGSGYQAAVLSCLAKNVYTIEIIDKLAKKARKTLKRLGYKNVLVKMGSGMAGWSERAPFDAIMITAGVSKKVPEKIFKQLKRGGVLVAPVGKGHDKIMTKYIKDKKGKLKEEKHGIFHFVPFIEN